MAFLNLGQLVTSKKGRDSGRMYVVVGFCDQGYVQVADGVVRTRKRPKRKNIKHLVVHKVNLGSETFQDRDIREFIKMHSFTGI
ncbi:MAG: KOW domain-containing protein [Firmicutes bacterium]|nr:KOW domain-containing protein [Bacillota bacterium]